jgi:SAM-dependent methyltransferase
LKEHINFKEKAILDIGGNTGFFSFEAIDAGAKSVHYIEGNKQHADFVKAASEYLNYNIKVENKYLEFNDSDQLNDKYDVVLLFNVIHHLGDDFGDQKISKDLAKEKMLNCIRFFASKTSQMVLQMGYCWKGDRHQLLFANGEKQEMIAFVKEAIVSIGEIIHIGIAQVNDSTHFHELSPENMKRNNAIGEFRNRPIFIINFSK